MAGMMCVVAGLMVSLSAPNGSISRKYTFLQRFFACQRSLEDPRSAKNGPSRRSILAYEGHFGATLGSLWVYGGDFSSLWDHYGMIVESLWVYEGPFSKKHSFSPQILMIL